MAKRVGEKALTAAERVKRHREAKAAAKRSKLAAGSEVGIDAGEASGLVAAIERADIERQVAAGVNPRLAVARARAVGRAASVGAEKRDIEAALASDEAGVAFLQEVVRETAAGLAASEAGEKIDKGRRGVRKARAAGVRQDPNSYECENGKVMPLPAGYAPAPKGKRWVMQSYGATDAKRNAEFCSRVGMFAGGGRK